MTELFFNREDIYVVLLKHLCEVDVQWLGVRDNNAVRMGPSEGMWPLTHFVGKGLVHAFLHQKGPLSCSCPA